MKKNSLNMIVGALLILIFGLLLFLFQVRTSEVVVVTTFGKPTRQITEPGLYAKAPWPIQKVHKLDKRIQNFESKFDEALTPDGYNLLVAVYAGWRISEPAAFFPKFAGGSVAEAERALQEIIRDAKSAVIGQHPFNHFISVSENELKFAEIENEILQRVRGRLQTNSYGIDIAFLGIKKLGLPESVTSEVFQRMSAERQVLVSKIESEGNARASTIRAEADRDAARLVSDAEAAALRIRGEAESKAAESLQTMNQEPELANFLLRLTGLEMFLRERTTLILDQNTSPLDLLNRPANASRK
ncbi:MAG TPA: protease modulator HflC [Candidatus Limnocylindria bacterium]|nr:protease modulator HflC [Candidatus Limnocylindria bacterium]